MNKRAEISSDVVEFIIKILILVVVLIFLTIIIRSHFLSTTNASSARLDVVEQKILSSPALIHYNNKLKYYEYEVFDFDKFTDENLNKTFSIDPKEALAVNLTLIDLETKEKKQVMFNKRFYLDMLAKSTTAGEDAKLKDNVKFPVLVYNKNQIHKGVLEGVILIDYEG